MKAILVLASGRDCDGAVFGTALSLARPLRAHLEFLQVGTPAVPRGVRRHSHSALRRFEELCEKDLVEIALSPDDVGTASVSAAWCADRGNALEHMLHYARHNDLTVVSRPAKGNGLPEDLVERLLSAAGRPVLLAPSELGRKRSGIAVVFWKETAASAKALAAAMPLLPLSDRVVLVSVAENDNKTPECIEHLARRLAWNGIEADFRWLKADARPVAKRLDEVANELDADLVVMGGHARSRTHQLVFGGCTRHFIERCERPVLLMH